MLLKLSNLRRSVLVTSALLLSQAAFPQGDSLQLSGAFENFAAPAYNEEGYRIWYLKGAKGHYISNDEVLVEDLQIRQHSGDATDQVISTAFSPRATFRREQALAHGPSSLTLENESFKLYGEDWVWAARDQRITLNQNVKITLFDSLGNSRAETAGASPIATIIESERALLDRSGDNAKFIFTGNVFLDGAQLDLDSDVLEVFATQVKKTEAGESVGGKIQRILAKGNVHIKQPNRVTTAGQAEVFPEQEKIVLQDAPRIQQDGLAIDGGDLLTIDRRIQQATFKGSSNNQVEAIGPALKNFSSNEETDTNTSRSTRIASNEAIVSLDEDNKTLFTFIDQVSLDATNLALSSDRLEAYAADLQQSEELFGKDGAFQKILATGNVEIAQIERTASAGKAEILPTQEKIVLSENPKLQQTDTRVEGGLTLTIDRAKSQVDFIGDNDHRVQAITTSISDLGFSVIPQKEEESASEPVGGSQPSSESKAGVDSQPALAEDERQVPAANPDAAAQKLENVTPSPPPSSSPDPKELASSPEPQIVLSNIAREPTQITSDNLYVRNQGQRTVFRAVGSTALRATNLKLDCDELETFVASESSANQTNSPFGGVQRILAKGNLEIEQEQLTAIADQAEVLPIEEKIILTGNPRGENKTTGATYEGSKIIFDRKNQKLFIEDSSIEGSLAAEEPEPSVAPNSQPSATEGDGQAAADTPSSPTENPPSSPSSSSSSSSSSKPQTVQTSPDSEVSPQTASTSSQTAPKEEPKSPSQEEEPEPAEELEKKSPRSRDLRGR
ncbi:MAG: LptA/OstA family protein [Verrucomicrobiota bacterium]